MEDQGFASRIEFNLPKNLWIENISKKFSEFDFEIHSSMPVDYNEMICNDLLVIKGINTKKCLDSLKPLSDLLYLKILKEESNKLILMVKAKNHHIIYTLMRFNLVIQFPVVIHNGNVDLCIAGFHDHIDEFLSVLHKKGIEFSIKNIGKYNCNNSTNSLTQKQMEVLEMAKEKGYYNIPREITLSDLAKVMNKSKSTLSLIFQRIHRQLVTDQIYNRTL